MSCSAADMFAFDESLGTRQSEGVSATTSLWDGESLSQRVSTIRSWFKAEQASAARLKKRPALLPPGSLILGFSLGGGGAAATAAAAAHIAVVDGGAAVDAVGVVSGCGDDLHVNGGNDSHGEGDDGFVVAGQALDTRNNQCLESSETERLISEPADMAMLLSEGSLAKNFRLEEMRQTLLDHAEDLDQASDNLAGLGLQLTGPSISLTGSPDAKFLHLHKLQDKELTSLQYGRRSALNFGGNNDTKVQRTVHNEASFSTWQLQDATTPASCAAIASSVASSSDTSSSMFSFTDSPGHLISSTRLSMPANVADTLLNGNSPATEACSHLSLQGQDRHAVWQKLSGSLSAVWQWLCSSGRCLTELARKLCKKLLTALGLGEDEAQRLLAQQQAEEVEALVVRSLDPLQPMNEPQRHPRLQRWRM